MRRYIQDILELSKGVQRFIASETLLGIGIGLYVLVFNLHLLELGFNEAEIGRITSLGTIIIGIFAIPVGLLANFFGRKKLLVTGLFLIGTGYLGIGIGQEYLTIYVSQIIASLGITFLITSEIQLLFSYSRSKKEETKAFSMLFATFTLFTGVGTLIGGFLPKLIGGATTIYQSTIIIAALLFFATAIIRGIILPREKTETVEKAKFASLGEIKRQLSNISIWLLSLYTFLIGASYAIVIPYLNIIMKFRFDWGDELISLLLTINGIFLFFGSILMPYVLERFGTGKTYLIIYTSTILLTFLLFFSIPVSFFTILLLTRGGSFTMLNNLIDSQTMQAVDEEDRNIFAGLRSVSRSLGSAIANLAAGVILASKNYSLPFLLSALLLLLGYIYFIFLVKPIFNKRNLDATTESTLDIQ